ncbi:hypothetical protein N7510_008237 [Penicillium lagena]|uniref:uncharacterized protein n=1 Tax=Penicillium lagena TaxID=94218 RepID=UPI00253FA0AE|nr:uncharacterized protein N7510_008237 [Penicillium lagena]KAJ5605456.1 hypothetical protein N7510_008237 [Penicillium lagena]
MALTQKWVIYHYDAYYAAKDVGQQQYIMNSCRTPLQENYVTNGKNGAGGLRVHSDTVPSRNNGISSLRRITSHIFSSMPRTVPRTRHAEPLNRTVEDRGTRRKCDLESKLCVDLGSKLSVSSRIKGCHGVRFPCAQALGRRGMAFHPGRELHLLWALRKIPEQNGSGQASPGDTDQLTGHLPDPECVAGPAQTKRHKVKCKQVPRPIADLLRAAKEWQPPSSSQ